MKTTCPVKGCNGPLQLRTSTREKQCYNCYSVFPWKLNKDQKPIY